MHARVVQEVNAFQGTNTPQSPQCARISTRAHISGQRQMKGGRVGGGGEGTVVGGGVDAVVVCNRSNEEGAVVGGGVDAGVARDNGGAGVVAHNNAGVPTLSA